MDEIKTKVFWGGKKFIERFTKIFTSPWTTTINFLDEAFNVLFHGKYFSSSLTIWQQMKLLSRYSELKEANIPTLTNQHSYKVSQFHKMLKNTYGKSLSKLQVSRVPSEVDKEEDSPKLSFSLYRDFSGRFNQRTSFPDCRTCVSTTRSWITWRCCMKSHPSISSRSPTSTSRRKLIRAAASAWCSCQHCPLLFVKGRGRHRRMHRLMPRRML